MLTVEAPVPTPTLLGALPRAPPQTCVSVTTDPQVPRGSLRRVPLTMQVPEPGMQRSEWPWH